MIYSGAELIAYVSIADGCSRATSSARAPSATARRSSSAATCGPGDVVELEVEGVGTLRSRFTATAEQYPWWPSEQADPFAADGAEG